jgi:hypothetical protein
VSAKDALWNDSAPNYVLYVADDRCVIMQLYYLQSEDVVQRFWSATLQLGQVEETHASHRVHPLRITGCASAH